MEPTIESLPTWVRYLVYVSIAAGTLKALHIGWLIQRIAKELKTNGGESVKDKVNAAAQDSEEALKLTKKLNRKVGVLNRKGQEQERRISNVESSLGKLSIAIRDKIQSDDHTDI